MVKFRRYIISQGDTIQSIAQYALGDMNRWVELAEFNNLRHPYIVDTVEEKLKNPDHLVTIGDTLLLRLSHDEQAQLITDVSHATRYDQEEIYALALGKDLDIMPRPQVFGGEGQDYEILEMKGDERGSLKTVRGIENLKQALFIRLITPRGGYLGHPNYGSYVHKYLGRKNTEENAALLNLEIERTLRSDGRVTHVELKDYLISGRRYVVSFMITAIGLEEAFEFAITAQEDGPIILLDSLSQFR